MIVTSIIAAPSKKVAVFYDPKTDELIYRSCEVIGLVQLEDPEDLENIQQVPCYMASTQEGYFFVPELEYDFLQYITSHEDLNIETLTPLIEQIKKVYKEAEMQVVEVETRGKVSTIKRTVKRLDDDDTTNKS